jgi:ABC-2 type transport system permease protein
MRARLRRVRALLEKEGRQTVRNHTALSVTFAGPLALLFLFAYSVNLDTERVPLGIFMEQSTPDARDLAGAFYNTHYFNSVFLYNRTLAEEALQNGEISGLVILDEDFARAAAREGNAPVQVLVDGVDARRARMVSNYAEGAVATWLVQRTLVGRLGSASAVSSAPRLWFNSEIDSRNFLVPGIIALLMAVIGPLLSALMVARERERGTMDSILATPATPREFLFAKLAFYMLLGMAAMVLMLVVAVHVIHVPFRGSIKPLVLATTLFILCNLALGLLISVVSRNQLAAVKLTLTTGFLPAYMLSGFLFDLRNSPDIIQWLSLAIPSRYFVSILQTVLLVGDRWEILLPDLAALALIAAAFVASVALLIRHRLG